MYALLILAAAMAQEPIMTREPHTRPVALTAKKHGDRIDLIVDGAEATSEDVGFKLTVESRGAGGSTTTVQTGLHRKSSPSRTLLRSSIHSAGLEHWSARLTVTAPSGDYSDVLEGAP